MIDTEGRRYQLRSRYHPWIPELARLRCTASAAHSREVVASSKPVLTPTDRGMTVALSVAPLP
jgi:hypothetical protein